MVGFWVARGVASREWRNGKARKGLGFRALKFGVQGLRKTMENRLIIGIKP